MQESKLKPPSVVAAPGERHAPFPLTDFQQAYWVGRRQDIELGGVTTHYYCEIDCQGSEAEPHRGFYFHMQEGAQSVLIGVKVINGWSNSGGGAICTDVSSPTITNCIFSNNTGPEAGGGMHVHDQSDPTVSGCIFSGNTTGASGGGIYISESSPAITDCTIIDNTASKAGGVAIYNSSPTLANCTISGNSPDGIDCAESGPTLQSSIVAFNLVGEGIVCAGNCDIVLNCSDVYGNPGGDLTECIRDQFGTRGNFSRDPLFCSPQTGDFHLQPASPCIPESTGCGLIGAWPVGCR